MVMDAFEMLIGVVLPYAVIAVLVLGLIYRLRRWQKAAVANLAIYPSASSKGQLRRKVLGEVLLFKTFRKEHKGLWAQTWSLHTFLLLIILGHTRLITDWPLRVLLGMSEGAVDTLSAWAGGIAGAVALVACVLLLVRRFAVRRVREASTSEDFFVMVLLIAILITGNVMRFLTHFDITLAQAYFASLFTLRPVQVPGDPMFLLHFFLVQVLLIYLPFGKLLHIPGVFYSKALVARDY
jgi:nitrate reductase gamma subunit